MMESWLAGRPALVWRGCAVTRGHVARSEGGLAFDSYNASGESVDWLLSHRAEAGEMGANGRRYVLDSYTWPDVFARFAATLRGWLAEEAAVTSPRAPRLHQAVEAILPGDATSDQVLLLQRWLRELGLRVGHLYRAEQGRRAGGSTGRLPRTASPVRSWSSSTTRWVRTCWTNSPRQECRCC